MKARQVICYFYFQGFDCLSLGAHICLSQPNFELHIPFGFFRIGWSDQRFKTKWIFGKPRFCNYVFGLTEDYENPV